MIKKQIIVENNKKIHNLLQDYGFTFADVNKMLRNKDVKVNGKAVKENIQVQVGDVVIFYYTVDMLEKKFEILQENDDFLIIFKYAGIEVEGEKGLEGVISGAKAVHRLDRNTEGVMVFAKNENTKLLLERVFKNHLVHKFYLAEVTGELNAKNEIFKAYLLKNSANSQVKVLLKPEKGSLEILTKINTIKSGKESSVVEVELLTGRTHQIRAHLAFLGHPIIGDGKYGKNEINKKFKEKRQKLACFKLKFDYIGIEGLNNKEFIKFPKWKSW